MMVLLNGGWVLWVIIALSITSFAIVIQKLWFLKQTKINKHFIDSLKQQLKSTDKSVVIESLKSNSSVESQLALRAI